MKNSYTRLHGNLNYYQSSSKENEVSKLFISNKLPMLSLKRLLFLPLVLILIANTTAIADECGCSSVQVIGTNSSSETDVSNVTLLSGRCYAVEGTLYIDEPTEWDGLTFLMRTGSVIIVEDDLSVINGSVLKNCGELWQGIQTTGIGKLSLTDCTIQGAEFGVRLVNGQKMKCQNVDFIDDYIGISAGNPFDNNNDIIIVQLDGQITGCQFFTDGILPDPYPGQYYDVLTSGWPVASGGVSYLKMYAAVFMKNCVGLVIGRRNASGSAKNEIYEARNGVIMLNSNAYIVQTEFHDFTGEFPDPNIPHSSHLTLNQVAIYTNRSSANIQWNYVEDVYVGIWGIESSHFITKCEFWIFNESGSGGIASTKGIHEERSQSLNIYDNKIYNGYVGIWIDNGTRPFTLDKNVLERNVPRANNEAIRVDGDHILGSVTGLIHDNDILFDNSESAVGITLEHVTGIKIDFNHITFDATIAAGQQNLGILIVDGTSCTISNNVIQADADYNNQDIDLTDVNVGVAVVNSKLTHVHCNEMENFDTDLWMVGPNHMTGLTSNFFYDANVGLEIYGPSKLGKQAHAGNQWLGSFDLWGALASGSDPIGTALYSQFIVDGETMGGIFIPDTYYPQDLFFDSDGEAKTCLSSPNLTIPNGKDLSAFIREDIDFSRFDDEMTWIAYADLYDLLLKHDSLLTYYPLDTFFSIYELEALGELMQVRDNLCRIPGEQISVKLSLENNLKQLNSDLIEIDSIISLNPMDKLDWADLRELKCDTILDSLTVWVGILDSEMDAYLTECDDALTDLSGITPTNDLEDYLKECLGMKASLTIDGYISGSDSIDILNMHELCPWYGGYALGIDYDVLAEITDSVPGHLVYICVSSEPLAPRHDVSNLEHKALVTPNPANDQITIEATSNVSEVRLFDFTSKLVFCAFPEKNLYTIDVNNLIPGVYLLDIIQGQVIQTEKVIITK